jgi:carbamoyl-phosphate synthase large subunit
MTRTKNRMQLIPDLRYRILTEASGSLTAGYLINSIKAAGHICIGSDIDDRCFGSSLADDFAIMPRSTDSNLWHVIEQILVNKKIDIVIPSLDETLVGWAERKKHFSSLGVQVILSDPTSVAVCQDKWLTFQFFADNGIPTPLTSLLQQYPLVKPRLGRGGVGISITDEPIQMNGMVSQELLTGIEYTIDIFCDRDSKPTYIVPRRRVNVKDGKSTAGVVERHEGIEHWVQVICERLPFVGPINIQCFVLPDGAIKFVEINPRIAGGMALGFAATENWIDLIVRNMLNNQLLEPKPILEGLEMRRYYAEVFVPSR